MGLLVWEVRGWVPIPPECRRASTFHVPDGEGNLKSRGFAFEVPFFGLRGTLERTIPGPKLAEVSAFSFFFLFKAPFCCWRRFLVFLAAFCQNQVLCKKRQQETGGIRREICGILRTQVSACQSGCCVSAFLFLAGSFFVGGNDCRRSRYFLEYLVFKTHPLESDTVAIGMACFGNRERGILQHGWTNLNSYSFGCLAPVHAMPEQRTLFLGYRVLMALYSPWVLRFGVCWMVASQFKAKPCFPRSPPPPPTRIFRFLNAFFST